MECQDTKKSTPKYDACLQVQSSSLDLNEIELLPLNEFNSKPRKPITRQTSTPYKPTWKGPLRALRLLILVAFLPALFIAVPLYMRYRVFSGQLYPVSMSDMRLIDKKVSTTWCQRQILHSNATFNAFLVPSQPRLATDLVPVSMTRHLLLEDDMKEYWGFYLLQGSVVTVSSCVRWPGASLILIRGHKHLQECAYIGDDSSEELDEILEANGGKLDNDTIQRLLGDAPTNKPGNMIRQLAEIRFHKPRPQHNHHQISPSHGLSEEKDHTDPVLLKNILRELRSKQEYKKKRTSQTKHEHIVTVPELVHRYRQTNVNEDEEKWLSFKDLEANSNNFEANLDNKTYEVESQITVDNTVKFNNTIALEEIGSPIEINDTTTNQTNSDLKMVATPTHQEKGELNEPLSSSEIYDDILKKVKKLGSRGANIVERLKNQLDSELNTINDNTSTIANVTSDTKAASPEETVKTADEIADLKLELLKRLLMDILEERTHKRKHSENSVRRGRRDISINPAIIAELNENDEDGNTAIEEGFEPDGYADHHTIINETTPNDMSNSEFWSSFSSSEEALLECKGLILNLPLTHHHQCSSKNSDATHEKIALANTITYRVPTNGYYFFVFNSENELQTNYIRVKFLLEKTVYDLTKGAVTECKNSTENCTIPLSFFSGEKVVLEVPLRNNDSLWNEEFVVMSECEPRTAIYIICVMAVPMLVVFLAFQ